MTFKELLLERGVKQVELASKSGVSQSRVSLFANGYFVPTLAEMKKLARCWQELGFDYQELYDSVPKFVSNALVVERNIECLEKCRDKTVEPLIDSKTGLELTPELIKIRKMIKKVGKCVAYGDGEMPIGEYDWDGNLKQY